MVNSAGGRVLEGNQGMGKLLVDVEERELRGSEWWVGEINH